jgi:hypothetical protein
LYHLDQTRQSTEIPSSDSPQKNTLKYLLTQNNKTEWMRKAIELDPYDTSQFIWIDFGIRHVFSSSSRLTKGIEDATTRTYNRVRMAGIEVELIGAWDTGELRPGMPLFDVPQWCLAGGVFGGDKDSLTTFANIARGKTQEYIKKGYLTWEVNIWYVICTEHSELFDIYKSNHDDSILENY